MGSIPTDSSISVPCLLMDLYEDLLCEEWRNMRDDERLAEKNSMLMNIWEDESGQGLVEYALVIALVSIVAILALQTMGKKASNTISNAARYLS